MKTIFFSLVILFTLSSCAQDKSKTNMIKTGTAPVASAKEAVATFGEGCFWHSEIVFQSLVGVRDAVSGYAGGTTVNPDYEEVGSGNTGHAEVVQVYYDPTKISYATLVKAFFASQDPTQYNRQGHDVGSQYRSIAFYRNAAEKAVINKEIASIKASGKYSDPIVTQVVPFSKFYTAEAYHQEYVHNNPGNSYVRNVSIPDFVAFRNSFKGTFK